MGVWGLKAPAGSRGGAPALLSIPAKVERDVGACSEADRDRVNRDAHGTAESFARDELGIFRGPLGIE